MFHFYTPWKRQKNFGFRQKNFDVSEGIEMENWAKIRQSEQ